MTSRTACVRRGVKRNSFVRRDCSRMSVTPEDDMSPSGDSPLGCREASPFRELSSTHPRPPRWSFDVYKETEKLVIIVRINSTEERTSSRKVEEAESDD